jgi:hypothetical protein
VRRKLQIVAVVVVLIVGLARCAGCSEECSGTRAGAPECPCSSDQDCSTQLGTVLICSDQGVCVEGDPDDVPGVLDCSANTDCPDGEACGGDGFCATAPECQRLSGEGVLYVSVVEGGAVSAAPIEVDGCAHSFQLQNPLINVGIEQIKIDGDMEFALGVDCQDGHWFAPFRLGRFVCNDVTIAVMADVDGATPCVGDDCAQCTKPTQTVQNGVEVGVCR